MADRMQDQGAPRGALTVDAFEHTMLDEGRSPAFDESRLRSVNDGSEGEYGRSSVNYVRRCKEDGFDTFLVDLLTLPKN